MDLYEFARWGEDLEQEFQGSSDRAAAIVGASMLDAQLRILFETRIASTPDKSQLFDGSNAPLHSFSGKSDLALAFGMIGVREHKNLTLIRRIRNAFAHQIGELSFETQEISNRCMQLEIPIGMRMPDEIPLPLIEDANSDLSSLPPVQCDTPRARFQMAVTYISKCFHGRFIELLDTRTEPRPDYERSSEIHELQLKATDKQKEMLQALQARVDQLREEYKKMELRLDGEKMNKETRKAILDFKREIEEQQADIDAIEESEAQKLSGLLGTMTQGILEFSRRWESWVEDNYTDE